MNNGNLAGKILTYTFVVFLFCIGIDKIVQTDLISSWQSLVGPLTHFLLPISASSIVMVEGAIEILLGVFLLTRWKIITLAVLAATITIVIVDLFALRYFNLAIREIMLVVVCFVIYLLDENTTEFIIK